MLSTCLSGVGGGEGKRTGNKSSHFAEPIPPQSSSPSPRPSLNAWHVGHHNYTHGAIGRFTLLETATCLWGKRNTGGSCYYDNNKLILPYPSLRGRHTTLYRKKKDTDACTQQTMHVRWRLCRQKLLPVFRVHLKNRDPCCRCLCPRHRSSHRTDRVGRILFSPCFSLGRLQNFYLKIPNELTSRRKRSRIQQVISRQHEPFFLGACSEKREGEWNSFTRKHYDNVLIQRGRRRLGSEAVGSWFPCACLENGWRTPTSSRYLAYKGRLRVEREKGSAFHVAWCRHRASFASHCTVFGTRPSDAMLQSRSRPVWRFLDLIERSTRTVRWAWGKSGLKSCSLSAEQLQKLSETCFSSVWPTPTWHCSFLFIQSRSLHYI